MRLALLPALLALPAFLAAQANPAPAPAPTPTDSATSLHQGATVRIRLLGEWATGRIGEMEEGCALLLLESRDQPTGYVGVFLEAIREAEVEVRDPDGVARWHPVSLKAVIAHQPRHCQPVVPAAGV